MKKTFFDPVSGDLRLFFNNKTHPGAAGGSDLLAPVKKIIFFSNPGLIFQQNMVYYFLFCKRT